MEAAIISQQEILDGQVFTVINALNSRFYVVTKGEKYRVMNDINKSLYAFITSFEETGFKVVGKFFGQYMSLFIKYQNCIKIIDQHGKILP
jgi:hypothetical protein